MKYFIGLGAIMWIDEDGHERFVPLVVDETTGFSTFTSDDLTDGDFADLDLVGDEEAGKRGTLADIWKAIEKASKD